MEAVHSLGLRGQSELHERGPAMVPAYAMACDRFSGQVREAPAPA